MGAHLRDIPKRKCATCTKIATKMLYNTRNALVNYYCSTHAQSALKRFKKEAGET